MNFTKTIYVLSFSIIHFCITEYRVAADIALYLGDWKIRIHKTEYTKDILYRFCLVTWYLWNIRIDTEQTGTEIMLVETIYIWYGN